MEHLRTESANQLYVSIFAVSKYWDFLVGTKRNVWDKTWVSLP